ncbi:hypothetical protein ACT0R3_001713, partial [Enterobacter cloacae]
RPVPPAERVTPHASSSFLLPTRSVAVIFSSKAFIDYGLAFCESRDGQTSPRYKTQIFPRKDFYTIAVTLYLQGKRGTDAVKN